MITRRDAMKSMLLGGAATAATARLPGLMAQAAVPAAPPPTVPTPTGPHTLPPLGYAFDALEPFIDAQTMQIHHDKHHAAYVGNLNKALVGQPDLAAKSATDLVRDLRAVPEAIRTAVRNHGGGHVNHAFFWQSLKKNDGAKPQADLGQALDRRFGSFAKFQEDFTKAAMSVFGSGWAWLTVDGDKGLRIETTPNQDSPLSAGRTPILGLDVWEHAYYLKYQNRRPEYVAAFHQVIHWDFVAEQYQKAVS